MCSFGSSASAPTTQYSTQTTVADPRATAMYNQAWQAAQQATNRPFTPYSYDPAAFVAPMNPVQLQATQNIMGMQGAASPFYQMGAGLAGASGTTTAPQVVGQYMSPYMSQVIDPTRAAIEQQQGVQRAQQQAEQIKAGAFGQERGQLMRAVLAGQQNLGLGQALSPLYQTGYGQALGAAQTDLARQLQAGQLFGQLGTGYQTAGLQGAEALMGAGTMGQQTQQKGLEALHNQFLMQQAYPFQTAQYMASVAGALGPQYGSTTSGLQSSMAPLSYMGMPMSDRRLKEGVDEEKREPEIIGQTNDGKNIYRYRLINPDTGELGPVQIGLMADEVEESNPEAVGDYNGFRTLDYERATDDAARMGGGVGAAGDYAAGGGVYGGSGYVPTINMAAGSGLHPAALSFMTPAEKKKYGLGESIKDVMGIYGTGKELYGDYKDYMKSKDAATLAANPSELSTGWFANGGSVYDEEPKSYVPDVDLQPGRGLEPAKLSFDEPEKKESTNYLGMAKDVGSLALMVAKAAPYLASLSDPRLKTGVRPHAADGMGIRAGSTGVPDLSEPDERPEDFERAVARTLKFEGGLNPNDVGHGPSMRGINQAAHPGIDVTKLTEPQTRDIYYNEYWKGVGADQLPSNMREIVYDTAVMAGPRRAKQILSIAGTDPEAYMSAREKFLGNLVKGDPEKYGPYARSWAARNAALRSGLGKTPVLGETPAVRSEEPAPAARPEVAPRGISGMIRGTAPEGVGEKALDFLTSERFLVPLLTGIGTAASSQSRFLAPALLQGLGAGAKMYGEMGQTEFEREKAREALGLEARKVGVGERELGLKEMEMRRKLGAASAIAKALSGGSSEIPYAAPAKPAGASTPAGETPVTAPVTAAAPSTAAAPEAAPVTTAPVAAAPVTPPVNSDFWSNVDPQSNPHVLDAKAQQFENAAVAAGQAGDPEYAKQLLASAQQYRSSASSIRKEGRILTKSGEVVLIPGFSESTAAVKKAETAADIAARTAGEPALEEEKARRLAKVKAETEPGMTRDIEEVKADVGRRYAPRVSPTGTKFIPPKEAAAAAPVAAPVAAAPAAPPSERPARAEAEPKTGRLRTAIPAAPPGGGMMIDPSLPPGAEISELSPQNAAIVENDKKFFGDFMERIPATEVALQRYKNIAQALKVAESGSTADQRLAFSALASTMGYQDLAEKISQGDPAAIELVKKNALNAVLDTLKAATPRFAQQEFTKLSDQGVPSPDRLPRTNFEMVTEAVGALERQKAFAKDWAQAQKEGWVSPTSFWQSWSEANPLDDFVKSASRQLGNFKGMPLPPAKNWAEGAIYVVPAHLTSVQASHMAKKGLRSGDMFMFGGWGEGGDAVMKPIQKSEAYSAHRGVQ